MSSLKNLLISIFLLTITITLAQAARFDIINNCSYTVWAAAIPGGGRQLARGQSWSLNVQAGTTGGRIWARTNCQFDTVRAAAVAGRGRQLASAQSWPSGVNAGITGGQVWARTNCQFDGSGLGKCETGDCGGVLECTTYGSPPNTIAEFALNQSPNQDFIDMSNIDGFNVPMEFSSTSGSCNRVIQCTANIIDECPAELRVPGGCNGPCTVFKTDEHCCSSGNCGPTTYSKFFKDRCPDVYSYPKDDATSVFTCPGGTNYKVVFCP